METVKIRWHGRGGQGAITAAKIVAMAAFASGYSGVVMAPSFGTERRGAPVMTSLKISREKIYDLSPIAIPDIVVILDHLLLKEVDVISGLVPGGLIVLNTPKPQSAYRFDGMRLATADVTAISVEAGLRHGMVNSGIIGVLGRAAGIVTIDSLLNSVSTEFSSMKPQQNVEACRLAYERTVLGG
jgi:2-oxoacid:acceptor oxidoreductase gamma subunit (pyruvate/2-ketoisovalerate family)